MTLKVGTFNLNNLFSRFNFRFRATARDVREGKLELKKIRKLVDEADTQLVEYEGAVLQQKDPAARQAVARRIRAMELDVLAVRYLTPRGLRHPVLSWFH